MREDWEKILEEAKTLALRGKWKEAREKYSSLLEKGGDIPGVFSGLGELELRANHPRKAEEYFREEKTRRNYPRLHQLLSISLIQQGKWKEAEEELHSSLSLDPEDFRPYVLLGYIYLERGEVQKAKGWLEMAREGGESSFPLYLYLAETCHLLGERGEVDRLLPQIRSRYLEMKELFPSWLRDALECEIRFLEGKFGEARKLWDNLKKSSFPTFPVYFAGLLFSPERFRKILTRITPDENPTL